MASIVTTSSRRNSSITTSSLIAVLVGSLAIIVAYVANQTVKSSLEQNDAEAGVLITSTVAHPHYQELERGVKIDDAAHTHIIADKTEFTEKVRDQILPSQPTEIVKPMKEPNKNENKVLTEEERLKEHKVFNNEVENVIEQISIPGVSFIEVPQLNMSDASILAYLKAPVEVYDDDSEVVAAAKERTAEYKTIALKYIEEGGTFNQFVRDICVEEAEKNATIKDVQSQKRRILEEEGEEAAQAFLDEVNPQLKAAGLKEVKISFTDRKLLERKRAKNDATGVH